jgi:TonB family protein
MFEDRGDRGPVPPAAFRLAHPEQIPPMIRWFRFSAIASFAALAAAAPAKAQDAAPADAQPPLSALLDSAGLVRAAAELGEIRPGAVPPLFMLDIDSAGAVTVRPMFRQMDTAYAGPVAEAIRARVKPQPPSPRRRSSYVRVATGHAARVDRPELHEDAPALLNRGDVARAVTRAVSENLGRLQTAGAMAYRAQLKFRILTDGTTDASTATVVQSSGDAALDDAALAVVGRMRFRPGTIERIPVAVWVTLPITFTVPGRE